MHLSFSPEKGSDAARRLIACIIGANEPTGNRAHEAVSAVEMHLLQRGWPVGTALGALPDVQKRLSLGRPACREAMIILEARGLLDVRRGPGGGVFVAAPSAEDVVGALLMYLTICGASRDCVQVFRLLAWRMVVEAAIDHGVGAPDPTGKAGEWGFAVDLAKRIGNPAMALVAQIAEMLVRTCEGRAAPGHDVLLERALRARNARQAISRVEDMASPMDLTGPLLLPDVMERNSAWSGRRSAIALAQRMTREMIHRPDKLEAEWETADRLGYSDAVVRQARRILQDFGIVRCQRGKKGALSGAPASAAGIIRLLAPCLIASGMTTRDSTETANFLACNAPRLAAGRAAAQGRAQVSVLSSFANSMEFIDHIRMDNLLLELAGNPLLSIMTRSLGLANLVRLDASTSPQRRVDIVAYNVRILRAIEAGDAETADLLARAKGEIQQSEGSYRKLA
jgi:DNA-binding FadR family transcriptional regulator